jgi:hypothetical protein
MKRQQTLRIPSVRRNQTKVQRCIEDMEAFYHARSCDSAFSDAVFHPISGEVVSLRTNALSTSKEQSEAESGKSVTNSTPHERMNGSVLPRSISR